MTQLATVDQLELFADQLPDHREQVQTYIRLGLDGHDAVELEQSAARIISLTRRSVVEVGQELVKAREKAQQGAWGAFLARVGIEERTAQNYMNVARAFGDKPEIISALPPTATYALAAPSADPQIVEAIIADVQNGAKLTVDAIKQRLLGRALPAPKPQPAAVQPEPRPRMLDIPTPLEDRGRG
jgi:hypothetical protein